MAIQTELTPSEAADRLGLRELFDAYAHCADRRDADGQKALFTVETRFAVFMDGEGSEPTYVLEGREALTPVFTVDTLPTARWPHDGGIPVWWGLRALPYRNSATFVRFTASPGQRGMPNA